MIVITHSKDLDGHASGAICKKRFPEAEIIGYDYGEEFPWEKFKKGDKVIMIDVSLPMSDMFLLGSKVGAGNFTWIDHHKSAINDYHTYLEECMNLNVLDEDKEIFRFFVTPVLEVGRAACEIGWEHLFPNMRMPKAIDLLGKYDTWRHNGEPVWDETILPFQYGMRNLCNSAETFPKEFLEVWSEEKPWELIRISDTQKEGLTILNYQKIQDEIACKKAFEKEFQGLRGLWLNAGYISSNTFASVWDPEKHDIMIGFSYNGDKWTFSLRSDKKEIDCSIIAKRFSGGGHAGASGFAVNSLEEVS